MYCNLKSSIFSLIHFNWPKITFKNGATMMTGDSKQQTHGTQTFAHDVHDTLINTFSRSSTEYIILFSV